MKNENKTMDIFPTVAVLVGCVLVLVNGQSSPVPIQILIEGEENYMLAECGQVEMPRNITSLVISSLFHLTRYLPCYCSLRSTYDTSGVNVTVKTNVYTFDEYPELDFEVSGNDDSGELSVTNTNPLRTTTLPLVIEPQNTVLDLVCSTDNSHFFNTSQLTLPEPTEDPSEDPGTKSGSKSSGKNGATSGTVVIVVVVIVTLILISIAAIIAVVYIRHRRKSSQQSSQKPVSKTSQSGHQPEAGSKDSTSGPKQNPVNKARSSEYTQINKVNDKHDKGVVNSGMHRQSPGSQRVLYADIDHSKLAKTEPPPVPPKLYENADASKIEDSYLTYAEVTFK